MKRKSAFLWFTGALIGTIAIAVAFHFDGIVQDLIARHQSDWGKGILLGVSAISGWRGHLVLGLLLASVAWWRGSKKWTRIFVTMLIALVLAGFAAKAIKLATGRARPFVESADVWKGPHSSSEYHSFPSGHASKSVAFFVILFLGHKWIALASLNIPLLIGFSRIYVQEHYLSDVVAAGVLGIVSAWVVARAFLFRPA